MKKTVLIIEDDKDVQDFYEVALDKFDVELIRAVNGRDAFRIIDSGKQIDLIVLDIVMPVMSGEEFLEELRNNRKLNLPVVVSSVLGIAATRLQSVADIQGVFFKLDRIDEFQELVRKNLNLPDDE